MRWSNRLWLAEVRDEQGKEVVLEVGAFASEEQAARAFDAGARLVRQECAHGGPCEGSDWRLNFPSAAEVAGKWARWRSAALDDQPVRTQPLASLCSAGVRLSHADGAAFQYVLKDYRAGRSRVPTPPPSAPKPEPDAAPEDVASGGQEEGQDEAPGGDEDPEGDGYKRLWSPEEDAQLALLVSTPSKDRVSSPSS